MSTTPNHVDMKEALSSGRKADTTHVRRAFQIYTARPCEYGDRRTQGKYVRANFRRPTGEARHHVPTGDDFLRFRAYLRAARDHIDEVLDAMELHESTNPELDDVEGMRRAAYAVDTDTKPGCPVGPSLLPHVAPACASLMMAITQATDCGLLPRDPGQPWRENKITADDGAPISIEFDATRALVDEPRPATVVIGGLAADLSPGESDLLPVPELEIGQSVRLKFVGNPFHGHVGEIVGYDDSEPWAYQVVFPADEKSAGGTVWCTLDELTIV